MRLFGLPFTVDPADVDESVLPGEPADALVVRLAMDKARRVAARTSAGGVVIGADTVVVVDGDVYGKPRDDDDARRMLRRLSGRPHQVMTGVAVLSENEAATAVEQTTVTFAELTSTDIDWYLASGDHIGKAGAYGVQGVAGVFITQLEGSFTNVVGLPLTTLRPMLLATGFRL